MSAIGKYSRRQGAEAGKKEGDFRVNANGGVGEPE